eukprot:3717569-Pyramimonas_sp.AAC.1
MPALENKPRKQNRTAPSQAPWRNLKLECYKAVHAPDRPLTDSERADFEDSLRGKWEELSDEERRDWSTINRGNYHKSRVQGAQDMAAITDDAPPPPYVPLWGQHSGGVNAEMRRCVA